MRNSKKGESFLALDNKEYVLDDGMCVISDVSGVLGLGGIIGGIGSGTEFKTKNIDKQWKILLNKNLGIS